MLKRFVHALLALPRKFTRWRAVAALNKKNVGISNIIAAGTEISGDVVFCGGTLVHGKISSVRISELESASPESLLVIERGAEVCTSEISCRNIVINGIVSAKTIRCSHSLELGETAVLNDCNIHYNSLKIAAGAHLDSCTLHRETPKHS